MTQQDTNLDVERLRGEIASLSQTVESILPELNRLAKMIHLPWATEKARMLGMDLAELTNIRSGLFSDLKKLEVTKK